MRKAIVVLLILVVVLFIATGLYSDFGKTIAYYDMRWHALTIQRTPWPNVFGATVKYEQIYSRDGKLLREQITVDRTSSLSGYDFYGRDPSGKVDLAIYMIRCHHSLAYCLLNYGAREGTTGYNNPPKLVMETADREFNEAKQRLRVEKLIIKHAPASLFEKEADQ